MKAHRVPRRNSGKLTAGLWLRIDTNVVRLLGVELLRHQISAVLLNPSNRALCGTRHHEDAHAATHLAHSTGHLSSIQLPRIIVVVENVKSPFDVTKTILCSVDSPSVMGHVTEVAPGRVQGQAERVDSVSGPCAQRAGGQAFVDKLDVAPGMCRRIRNSSWGLLRQRANRIVRNVQSWSLKRSVDGVLKEVRILQHWRWRRSVELRRLLVAATVTRVKNVRACSRTSAAPPADVGYRERFGSNLERKTTGKNGLP